MIQKVIIGDATLYRSDCLRIVEDFPPVDAFITDPPYSSGGMMRGDRMTTTGSKYQSSSAATKFLNFSGDNRDQRSFMAWATLWLMTCQEVAKPGAMLAMFSDWRQLPTVTDAVQAGGWVWRGILPWNKINARPLPNRFRNQCEYIVWGTNGPRDFDMANADYHPGILAELPPTGDDREHSTQKPIGIMQTLARVAPPGGLIADLFLGSGTTAIGAIREGRKFIGCEKDPEIFDLACRRVDDALRQAQLFPGETA